MDVYLYIHICKCINIYMYVYVYVYVHKGRKDAARESAASGDAQQDPSTGTSLRVGCMVCVSVSECE